MIFIIMENNEFIERFRYLSDKCRNMYDLCTQLGYTSFGGNTYRDVKEFAENNNIDLIFNKNLKQGENISKLPMSEILVEHCEYKNLTSLKKRLIKEGYIDNKCSVCGINEWLGYPISLQLHHINGKHDDNRLENLQLLCPNCHSITDNYAGKNTRGKRIRKTIVPKERKSTIPVSKDDLEKLIHENSFVTIGKMFNVSDTSIKKWCKKYGLPYRRKDIK